MGSLAFVAIFVDLGGIPRLYACPLILLKTEKLFKKMNFKELPRNILTTQIAMFDQNRLY